MSVAYEGHYQTWDDLVRTWCELDVPEGYRPELTIEGIIMTPSPGGPHNLIADLVHRALLPGVPAGYGLFQTQSVGVPQTGGIYIPDFTVALRAALPEDSSPVLAEHILLVAEITSRSNAKHDRAKKKWAYAHGPIPQYLLIDPHDPDGPAASLFSDPVEGVYGKTIRVPFGRSIMLGPPLGIELDTAKF